MSLVAVFGFILFAVGSALGFYLFERTVWNWVDVIYYPLAATGVALLFLSGTTQRNILQVEEQLVRNRAVLIELEGGRPPIDGVPPTAMLDNSFKLIAGIVELADVCSKVPHMDSTCSVAEKMRSAAAEFTAVSTADYETPEHRLAATCEAGTLFIARLRTREHMSSLVGDELAAQYQEARSRPRYYLDYAATVRDAEQFEGKARIRVAEVRRMIDDKSDAMTYVFAVYNAEIRTGSTVMRALYPCVAVTQKTLRPFVDWTVVRQSQETEKARLEEMKRQVQSTPAMSRSLQWMQLNLWPFVLIAGLALKFAKGVATVRKSVRDGNAGTKYETTGSSSNVAVPMVLPEFVNSKPAEAPNNEVAVPGNVKLDRPQ